MADRINDIVLVHGGFVDGSGWVGVYNILEKDGFNYITAFAPDPGELVNTLIANPPPGAPVPPPVDGYLFLDKQKFAASFAGDADVATAKFMADSQVPWGVNALAGTITTPGWKSKPSAAIYVQARRRNEHGSSGKSRDLCVASERRRCTD
jgi:hypothetical protein